MSGEYLLGELAKRWQWGNLTQTVIDTRSADVLDDWARISKPDADAAVQLLRRREYHKGNFMPSADEIETAVSDARKNRLPGTATGEFRAADPLETRRHSVTGRTLGARASHWQRMEIFYGSVDSAIDAYLAGDMDDMRTVGSREVRS